MSLFEWFAPPSFLAAASIARPRKGSYVLWTGPVNPLGSRESGMTTREDALGGGGGL